MNGMDPMNENGSEFATTENPGYTRRRRSERHGAPAEEMTEQPAMEEAAQDEGFSHAYREAPRRAPANVQYTGRSTDGQNVPRPAALNRAPQGQSGQNVRRPVAAPGYSQRQPLSARQSMQADAPRPPRRAMPVENDDSYDEPAVKKGKGRGVLVVVVIVVLVLALAVLGFMLIPEDDSTLGTIKQNVVSQLSDLLGQENEPDPVALDFSAAPVQGTAPLDVALNLTTTLTVEDVRVVDGDGNVLGTSTAFSMDNADSRIWMLNLSVTDGFTGVVQAQIMGEDESWQSTGKTVALNIAAAPQATATQEPELEPTEEPTQELTAEPEPTETAVTVMAELATAEPEEATEEPTTEPVYTPEPVVTATPTMEVTATPTIAPTEVPTLEPTETPEPTAEPTATVAPTAAPVAEAVSAADPKLIGDTVVYEGTKKVSSYNRAMEDIIQMPAGDAYTTLPYGVLTFRGNAFRQNAASGTSESVTGLTLQWSVEAGSVKGSSSTYYGIGWYGQPAIVKWSKEIRENSNIVEEKRTTSALKEVIVAGLDGKIYFLDLADGQPTRDVIDLGYPMKGSPSIHSLGYPVMTVGQYARKMASGTGKIGLRFYNLLNQKQMYMIDGLDGDAKRPYYSVGAFDTSSLIDPKTDTAISIGTNGMLYLTKLNTELDVNDFTLDIDPESVVMKSRTSSKQKDAYTAVESSLAMYANYAFYADMDGILRCVDTSTLTTAWAVDTGDAVQAAIALDLDEDGQLWLYTINTLQNRTKGDVTIRRFNALTGEESWKVPVGVTKGKKTINGGMASPVIGQNGLSDLVYFTVTGLSKAGTEKIFGEAESAAAAVLLAMDKTTGDIVWQQELDSYSYSSPVAAYTDEGDGWIIQATGNGTITLYNGLTGKIVDTLEVEGTIEGSPAVYKDMLVIGTTGKNTSFIYGISLNADAE